MCKFKNDIWNSNNSTTPRNRNNQSQQRGSHPSYAANAIESSQNTRGVSSQDNNSLNATHGFTANQLQQLAHALSQMTPNHTTGNDNAYVNDAGLSSSSNAINPVFTKLWILDSGATYHITTDSNLFTHIDISSTPIDLAMGKMIGSGKQHVSSQPDSGFVLPNFSHDATNNLLFPSDSNLDISPSPHNQSPIPHHVHIPSTENNTTHEIVSEHLQSQMTKTSPETGPSSNTPDTDSLASPNPTIRRSTRPKQPPTWHKDYICLLEPIIQPRHQA
ncbi:hypothetical protein L6164_036795 [Bauhinia variegata]|uniref:Uncharacterized protein n=1 Tax=Bauhinia variegata TaxID=167791 RepID=A0ACB9KIB4_BAUVA|nr:hypothetical protein L6164_036795 [Bauhinia variegata]